MRKKVIYIGPFELPNKNAAAHRVLNNGKILNHLGYEVIFIDFKHDYYETESIFNEFTISSQKYPVKIKDWIDYLIHAKNTIKIINKYESVDLIILYNYPAISSLQILKYASKRKIKVIADITEWYLSKNVFKKIDTELRMRYVNKKLDGIICISNYLYKYYTKSKKILLPPLVDVNEEKWNIDRRLSIHSEINLVFSGTIGVNKERLDLVIQEFLNTNISQICKLDVYGITLNDIKKIYPQLSNIDAINEVKFHGRVSNRESLQAIANADYFVFFRDSNRSNNAGFPTKFVEAYTLNVPIITNDTSDLNEYSNCQSSVHIIELKEQALFSFISETKKGANLRISSTNSMFHYGLYIEKVKYFLDEL